MLAHLPHPHDTAVALLVETGMRRGELAAMQWEQVDWSVPSVLLPDTKNGTAREVPLSTAAVTVFEGLNPRPAGPVWGMAPQSFSQAFIRACKRAGIEDLRLHDLRHEATSRLVETRSGCGPSHRHHRAQRPENVPAIHAPQGA